MAGAIQKATQNQVQQKQQQPMGVNAMLNHILDGEGM